MVCLCIAQAFQAEPFGYIGKASEHILHRLRCFIAYVGKCTEACYICEILIVERAYINVSHFIIYDLKRSSLHIFRYAEAGGKVVHRSCGNISKRYFFIYGHKSLYCFVERTVAAACYYNVKILCTGGNRLVGIELCLCGVNSHFIAVPCKNVNNIQQMKFNLTLARKRIKNK